MELFRDLSVFENLIVATRPMTAWSVLADLVAPKRRRDESDERWALELVGRGPSADKRPGELSLGQAKMLGVARAIGTRPKVVLLDEPAAGLDSDESTALGSDFKLIVEHSISIMLIDHDMDLIARRLRLRVCAGVPVHLIAEGRPVVRDNDDVIAAYLGEEAGAG